MLGLPKWVCRDLCHCSSVHTHVAYFFTSLPILPLLLCMLSTCKWELCIQSQGSEESEDALRFSGAQCQDAAFSQAIVTTPIVMASGNKPHD